MFSHDFFIFQDSLIYDKLNDEIKDLEDGFLIGDSGYGCKLFLMTPYPHPSTQHQEGFNEALGKTRVKIEQLFRIFKRRFHLMHSEIRMDPVKVLQRIGACAVFHNIAKQMTNQMYPHMMALKMGWKLEITFVNITSECFAILLVLCCMWY